MRHQPKLHIKKGDTVKVIAGDEKGNTGIVSQVFPDKSRALVEGLNMVKRHYKPTANTPGGIVDKEASMHISNLMVVEPKTKEATRTGRRVENGKSVRYSKKTNNPI